MKFSLTLEQDRNARRTTELTSVDNHSTSVMDYSFEASFFKNASTSRDPHECCLYTQMFAQ